MNRRKAPKWIEIKHQVQLAVEQSMEQVIKFSAASNICHWLTGNNNSNNGTGIAKIKTTTLFASVASSFPAPQKLPPSFRAKLADFIHNVCEALQRKRSEILIKIDMFTWVCVCECVCWYHAKLPDCAPHSPLSLALFRLDWHSSVYLVVRYQFPFPFPITILCPFPFPLDFRFHFRLWKSWFVFACVAQRSLVTGHW